MPRPWCYAVLHQVCNRNLSCHCESYDHQTLTHTMIYLQLPQRRLEDQTGSHGSSHFSLSSSSCSSSSPSASWRDEDPRGGTEKWRSAPLPIAFHQWKWRALSVCSFFVTLIVCRNREEILPHNYAAIGNVFFKCTLHSLCLSVPRRQLPNCDKIVFSMLAWSFGLLFWFWEQYFI